MNGKQSTDSSTGGPAVARRGTVRRSFDHAWRESRCSSVFVVVPVFVILTADEEVRHAVDRDVAEVVVRVLGIQKRPVGQRDIPVRENVGAIRGDFAAGDAIEGRVRRDEDLLRADGRPARGGLRTAHRLDGHDAAVLVRSARPSPARPWRGSRGSGRCASAPGPESEPRTRPRRAAAPPAADRPGSRAARRLVSSRSPARS